MNTTKTSRYLTMSARQPLQSDGTRHKITKLIMLLYAMLLIEGIVRKWLVPGSADVFFFIRVPLLLVIYWRAFKAGLWPRNNGLFGFGMICAFLGVDLVPFQMFLGNYSLKHLIIVAYGIHNYFLYIPLPFIMAKCLTLDHLKFITRVTAWIVILCAPLVVKQYYSQPDSFIVAGSGGTDEYTFAGLGYGNHTRPTGLFTSSLGQQMFVSSALVLLLALRLDRMRRSDLSTLVFVLALVAVLLMVGFSAQRGLVVQVGLVFLFYMWALSFIGKLSFNFIYIPALLALGFYLYLILFPDVAQEFSDRWLGASISESVSYGTFGGGFVGRIFYELFQFLSMFKTTPPQGYLLGMAGNASMQLPWVQHPPFADQWTGPTGWGESGLSRHIIDLGWFVGPITIAFRFFIMVSLLRQAIRVARSKHNFWPLIFMGFLTPILSFSQMTAQGTVIGFSWIFIGFCMAAIRDNGTIHLFETSDRA